MPDETADLRLEALSKVHDRASFSCGVESLDTYLKTQASQDVRRKANAVFVLTASSSRRFVLGYFTLCAYGLAPGVVPDEARRHLPRYPLVSATLLGRLAVHVSRHGQGLGGVLLAEALRKAYDNADVVGSTMVVVDALDEKAASFYAAHGFVRLPESARLVLPMKTIAKLFASGPGVSKAQPPPRA
ncbi:MAG: GNAT family N-acetyltransferase [Deltaproteobacteria bacterium]|nr:GNAT family N-acetyltransferase [Deltaproteobacteria bacterium]